MSSAPYPLIIFVALPSLSRNWVVQQIFPAPYPFSDHVCCIAKSSKELGCSGNAPQPHTLSQVIRVALSSHARNWVVQQIFPAPYPFSDHVCCIAKSSKELGCSGNAPQPHTLSLVIRVALSSRARNRVVQGVFSAPYPSSDYSCCIVKSC